MPKQMNHPVWMGALPENSTNAAPGASRLFVARIFCCSVGGVRTVLRTRAIQTGWFICLASHWEHAYSGVRENFLARLVRRIARYSYGFICCTTLRCGLGL